MPNNITINLYYVIIKLDAKELWFGKPTPVSQRVEPTGEIRNGQNWKNSGRKKLCTALYNRDSLVSWIINDKQTNQQELHSHRIKKKSGSIIISYNISD
jgi:hypothetical protein